MLCRRIHAPKFQSRYCLGEAMLHPVRVHKGGTIMRRFMLAIGAMLMFAQSAAWAGPCDNPNDRASDGSRCGGRSSSERPGGK